MKKLINKKLLVLIQVLTAGLLILISCSKDDKSVNIDGLMYNGIWEGETAETYSGDNLPVYFEVNEKNQIDTLFVKMRVDWGSDYCIAPFYSNDTVEIINNSFEIKLRSKYIGFISGSVPVLTGRFINLNECEGEVDTFKIGLWICGSELRIGTGATQDEIAWNSYKKELLY